MEETISLLQKTKKNCPHSNIVWYGTPVHNPEKRWTYFGRQRAKYNSNMRDFCQGNDGFHYVEPSVSRYMLWKDNVHLLRGGEEKQIVEDLKDIINPLLGMSRWEVEPERRSVCQRPVGNRRHTSPRDTWQTAPPHPRQSYQHPNYRRSYQGHPRRSSEPTGPTRRSFQGGPAPNRRPTGPMSAEKGPMFSHPNPF